ncbi:MULTISPECIES: DUF2637 domain-containing protein [Streptomycetaceae]|uniref:Integral membrane protein n=1 Tax=Streptantibioticus cattleyicolor (strain ATCC 35852 / DSM 46488 / JCM 4925 / NBRC 14057 / NRRL 8057) TaxID=1003195 RepID=F8K472_STREN|nr:MULTISPECIES: DUF2637 domain-containing protein [Streptomycetaceae]AEW92619.1 integral membrane protein [Streptantibioticus cattleyicolor NRRL 8057 = DSM 46488]MYS57399.1 DUF2637 domain-containing protein [Streptomyces sp. SID5468]CCB72973.1 membrane protein of unknown function [Streptantibioticus cattleyicolor NRRL 8057 = DSM 46488]
MRGYWSAHEDGVDAEAQHYGTHVFDASGYPVESYPPGGYDTDGYGIDTHGMDPLAAEVHHHDATVHPVTVPHPEAEQGEFGEFERGDGRWEFDDDLDQLLQAAAVPEAPVEEPAPEHTTPVQPYARRHRRRWWAARLRNALRAVRVPWVGLLSLLMAATTAVIVAMVSVLGGVMAYDPLRRLAAPGHSHGLAGWWPLLVYGPWLVASLSILRAAVHRRRAAHSWAVVVLFSAIAVYLCVAHTTRTVVGVAVAGLPPVTALVSFHQLVRQITLTTPPRHAVPRPRHSGPRP